MRWRKFYGMGYIPADAQIINPKTLKDYLTVYKENSVIRNLISGSAAGFRDKVFMFNPTIESSHPMASAEKHELLQPEE
jgi:hypothetical protein